MLLIAYIGDLDPDVGRKLAICAWGALAIGVLFGFLPATRPHPAIRPLVAGLGVLTVLTALGLLTTSSAERTFDEIGRVSGFAGALVLGVLALRRASWRTAAAGLMVGSAAVCGLAVTSRVFPDLFSGAASSGDRLAYPFGYWNALAAWSAMTFTMLIAWSADGRDRGIRSAASCALPVVLTCQYLTHSRGGLLTSVLGVLIVLVLSSHRSRVVAYGAFSLVAAAVPIVTLEMFDEIAEGTGAYGGPIVALALALASLAMWFLPRRLILRRVSASSMWKRPSQGKRLASRTAIAGVSGLVAALILVPVTVAVFDTGEPVAAEVPNDSTARVLSLDGNRPLFWDRALDAFTDEPLTGIGPGTYEFWWSQHGEGPEEVRDAHSFYLEQLAELGAPGLLAALLFAGGMLWLGLLPRRIGEGNAAAVALPAAIAVLVSYMAIDWIWESNQVMLLGIGCAVAAGASGSRSLARQDSRTPASRARRRASGLVTALLLALGVAGLAIQVPGLVSASRIEASGGASFSGLDDDAIDLAGDAIDAEPWAATPYSQRASVELAANQLPAAIDDLGIAAEHEPENFRYPLTIAGLEVRLGNAVAARQSFETAKRLAPRALGVSGPAGDQLEARISALEVSRGIESD